jgi:hypothetical protein
MADRLKETSRKPDLGIAQNFDRKRIKRYYYQSAVDLPN